MRPCSRMHPIVAAAAIAVLATTLAGCNLFNRLSDVSGGPELTKITNPTARPSYRPVSMPMPAPSVAEDNPNSLWRTGARAFFKDQRASEIGDILTVKLQLDEKATLNNKTERDRTDSEVNDITRFLGLEAELAKKLPQAVLGSNLTDLSSRHDTTGDGSIDRSEAITVTLAAVITQILPNGNLVIMGRQEILVNAELREVLVTGIVRPVDIDSANTVSHQKIAELRIGYGGRGTLSELQQPRWGMQILDIVFPF